ncbi:MAG: hypothetical protein KOO60_07340 [Gemmatimonadales bacterium]|nr:hypothetical protein [Gemmatimonadales bacterium]
MDNENCTAAGYDLSDKQKDAVEEMISDRLHDEDVEKGDQRFKRFIQVLICIGVIVASIVVWEYGNDALEERKIQQNYRRQSIMRSIEAASSEAVREAIEEAWKNTKGMIQHHELKHHPVEANDPNAIISWRETIKPGDVVNGVMCGREDASYSEETGWSYEIND